jgi:hypothetical protein
MKLSLLLICWAILAGASGASAQSGNLGNSSGQSDQASSQSGKHADSRDATQPAPDNDLSQVNGATPEVSASPTTPWLPNAVNGETGSVASFEGGAMNFIAAGVSMAGTYDDDAFSRNGSKVANVGYMVAPNIALHESRPRTDLSLSYSPGFSFNQRTSPQYSAAHKLAFEFQYRLTEHVTTRLREGLVYGSTSFNTFTETQFESSGSVLHESNSAVLTPLATRLTSSSGADLIDQIGEKTIVGVSGDFTRLHFLNGSSSRGLLDNESWGADAFYSTRVSGNSSIGLTFSHQNLETLGSLREHTNSDSGLIFYTLYPKPRVTLSFFAGPSYVTNHLGSSEQSTWLVDGGVTLAWQGARTAIQLSAIHNVSDGGGLTGAVRSYSVNSAISRNFAHQFVGTVDVSYSENSVLAASSDDHFYAIDAGVGIQKTIFQRFGVGLMYSRDHQTAINPAVLSNVLSDHNRAWVSVSYSFLRPLGR